MFDAKDPKTTSAIRALRSIATERSRPIVLWLGAGVGRWCGYASWDQLAQHFHSRFLREAGNYNRSESAILLETGDLPALFQACRDTDRGLYHRLLADSFGEARPTPVFDRLVRLLTLNAPVQVLTTNVDESLEKHLNCITVQRSDVERLPQLLQSNTSFVCKLHGTISAIETAVFTREDYDSLTANKPFLKTIDVIFSNASVVFLGFGLRDKYVLEQLANARAEKPLFGAGPHFGAASPNAVELPPEVQRIGYLDDPRHDHRGALQILDVINRARSIVAGAERPLENQVNALQSAYFIAHFLPPGSWVTSQQVSAEGDGRQIHVTIGPGFVAAEVPSNASTAMHDLAVGLICFDLVYLPFSDLAKVHHLISSQWFSILVNADLLRFVHSPREPAVIFPDPLSVTGGDLGMLGRMNKGGQPITIRSEIQRMFSPARGQEAAAQSLFDKLTTSVIALEDHQTAQLPELVRGALIHPSVQKMLGISEAFLPTQIPRWNVFPALRLASLILAGQVCQHLKIPAARVGFGGEALVGAAFSIAAAQDWAGEVASYVLGGTFNTDLGEMIFRDPQILNAILQFRDTQEGVSLRQRIKELLLLNEGAEFVASVNASLKRNIPGKLLDDARNQLSGLLMPQVARRPLAGAVWNNMRNSDSSLRLWRARSLSILEDHCRNGRIETYDTCPCGSGEKLRFCCLPPLKT